ncbi:DUF4136 domain-containing protein [Stutzerimonas azotifigens]|uniref:DUF4136 domain-containing protein n=1 Tax=Stutzerimonas azotifigens TaxID=291995 RepID=UPI0003FA104C|nr:DUF4136 domain-containing protein [Stutzerimonas azotifigens]
MIQRLFLLPALLLLAACQTVQLERDFDPNRDFSGYRQWSWRDPAVRYQPEDPRLQSDLTEQRVREAVDGQLEQRGLRPAPAGSQGDLQVQAWLMVDKREQQMVTHYGSMWGPWSGYWGPGYTEARTVEYQVGTLQVDLYDARDGKLVWRGSASQVLPSGSPGPQERATAIRETVAKVLSQYPPH